MKKIAFTASVMLAFLFLFNSCAKTVQGRWVVYYETNFLPPWVSEKSDWRTKDNLEELLKGDGIIPLKIRIRGEREPECPEWDCFTGKTYHIQVDKSQLNLIYYYGFVSE